MIKMRIENIAKNFPENSIFYFETDCRRLKPAVGEYRSVRELEDMLDQLKVVRFKNCRVAFVHGTTDEGHYLGIRSGGNGYTTIGILTKKSNFD